MLVNIMVLYFIKGLLYLFNLQPWGHSVLNLLNECEKQGIKISPELKKNAKDFELHYTRSRYPDALPFKAPKDVYDEKTAKKIQHNTKLFLDFIKSEMEARIPK